MGRRPYAGPAASVQVGASCNCMQLIMMVMDRGSFGSIGILGYACSGGVAGVFQSA
jgi:hypothetical protein